MGGKSEIVFLTGGDEAASAEFARILGECIVVRDLKALKATQGGTLLCFGSGVIVPKTMLDKFTRAYNIHAASPEFPGRDPHHWAVYAGTPRYGATMHVMTERVDSGPIVDVEWFDVRPGASPRELLSQANVAGCKILQRVARTLRAGKSLPRINQAWSGKIVTRADTLAMCELTPDLSEAEIGRREAAFEGFPLRRSPGQDVTAANVRHHQRMPMRRRSDPTR